jgi:hypothetical protein
MGSKKKSAASEARHESLSFGGRCRKYVTAGLIVEGKLQLIAAFSGSGALCLFLCCHASGNSRTRTAMHVRTSPDETHVAS